MLEQKKADYGAVALLVALPLLLFADVFFLGAGFYWRDLITYHWPMRSVIREALLSGSFPYWNPFHLNGQPMAANPAYEIFYPPQLLILMPDFAFGFQTLLMFHLLLGLVGMYLFLRSLPVSPVSALFGAVSFGFGGLFLSALNLNPFFFSIAWFPLVFHAFRRMVLTGGRRYFVGSVGGLVMILLITEPASVLQIGLFLLAYIAYRALEKGERRELPRRIRLLATVCLLAAGVASIQLIPAVDFARETKRAIGFPVDFALSWSFPPVRLLELFFSNVMGPGVRDGMHFWGARFYEATGPFYKSIYGGALMAVLAAAWLAVGGRGARTFIFAAPIAFVVAIGSWTIFGRLLHDIGLFQMVRYPEKWITLIVVPLPLFAALAFERLIGGDGRIRRAGVAIAALLLIVIVAIFLMLAFDRGAAAFIDYFELRGAGALADVANARRAAFLNVVVMGLVCVLLLRYGRMKRGTSTALAMLLLAADLGSLIDGLVPRMPRDFFEAPRIAQEAHAMVEYPRLWHLDPGSHSLTDDYYIRLGAEQKWATRNVMEGMLPEASFIRTVIAKDIDGTALVPTALFDDTVRILNARLGSGSEAIIASVARTNLRSRLLPFEQALPPGREVEHIRPAILQRTPGYSPVYFASAVMEARAPLDAVQQIVSGKVTGDVVAAPAPEKEFDGEARVLGYRSSWNDYEIETVVGEEALLVVATTPHRYWKAFVDGEEAEVIPVNLISAGIVLREGSRSVVMRYGNPMIRYGAIVSALSILLLAWIAFGFGRKRSPAPSADAGGNARHIPEHRG